MPVLSVPDAPKLHGQSFGADKADSGSIELEASTLRSPAACHRTGRLLSHRRDRDPQDARPRQHCFFIPLALCLRDWASCRNRLSAMLTITWRRWRSGRSTTDSMQSISAAHSAENPARQVVVRPAQGADRQRTRPRRGCGCQSKIRADLRKMADEGIGVIVHVFRLPGGAWPARNGITLREGPVTTVLAGDQATQEEVMHYATR